MLLVFVGVIFFLFPIREKKEEFLISGLTMGNISYNIKYISDEPLINKNEIDSILISFNNIFSTYIPTSEISAINQSSGKINISSEFRFLLNQSFKVFDLTDGYFDPTIGPLVNLWGFGPDKLKNNPKKSDIQDLLEHIGLNKVSLNDNYLIKDENTYIDFSSIAKGYAVYILSDYLLNKRINNFFVEIGGEVRTKGKNIKSNNWIVGIETPFE